METKTSEVQIETISKLVSEIDKSNYPGTYWEKTVKLAREEKERGFLDQKYNDIDVEEVVSFGEKIIKADSIPGKYRLMVEKTESGKLWYEVLLGDSNMKMFNPVVEVLKKDYKKTHLKWPKAADIGTGIGNTLSSISPFCEKVYGVDLAFFALDTAKENNLPENASLVNASADKLPFNDKSLDLIVSNGLIFYLSPSETLRFVREVFRTLRIGGVFYHSTLLKNKNEDTMSYKEALIDLLGRLANNDGHPNSLGLLQFTKALIKNGFMMNNYRINKKGNWAFYEYRRMPISNNFNLKLKS